MHKRNNINTTEDTFVAFKCQLNGCFVKQLDQLYQLFFSYSFFRSVYSTKIWDFLQDTLPKFKHQEESLTVTKPDIADPAAGTDSSLNDNKSLLLEPNVSQGPDCVAIRHTYTLTEKICYEQTNICKCVFKWNFCFHMWVNKLNQGYTYQQSYIVNQLQKHSFYNVYKMVQWFSTYSVVYIVIVFYPLFLLFSNSWFFCFHAWWSSWRAFVGDNK